MRTKIRRYAKVLLSLFFGLLLLWLITRGQDVDQIISELRGANYLWIALAMLCAVASHFLRAIRWNRLIRTMGYETSTIQTFHAVMTGYLANLAIPRMGEITRCVTLSKASKTPFNALAGTVVSERVFDFFSLIGVVFLTIALQFNFLKSFLYRFFWVPAIDRSSEHWLPIAFIGLVVISIVVFAVVFMHRKLKDPFEGSYFHKLQRHLSGFLYGIKTIKKMRGKALFMLQSLLIWTLYYLTVYLCFFAIPATSHLSPAAGLTLLAVGSLGILAPVPGGIGTYHFMTIITLTELYSISAEPATSYAYIAHATQIIVSVVIGTLSWFILSLQAKKTAES